MHHGLKIKPHLCILWGAVKAMKHPQYPPTACVNLLKQLEHTLFLFTLFCGCFSLPPSSIFNIFLMELRSICNIVTGAKLFLSILNAVAHVQQ